MGLIHDETNGVSAHCQSNSVINSSRVRDVENSHQVTPNKVVGDVTQETTFLTVASAMRANILMVPK